MRILKCDTYEEMSRSAADQVAAQLLVKPDSHLGLTAGKTPLGMFAELVKLFREGRISFARAHFYNLEEMVGWGPEDEASCCRYLRRNLIDLTDADPKNLLLPNGLSSDIDSECAKYDALFDALPDGRLDMQVLGIGSDGHIGCNRPQEKLHVESHNVRLGPDRYAAAMGMRSILLAKRLVLVANGKDKAQAVADMCGGVITTAVPATFLQLHPDVTVILDKDAASLI